MALIPAPMYSQILKSRGDRIYGLSSSHGIYVYQHAPNVSIYTVTMFEEFLKVVDTVSCPCF